MPDLFVSKDQGKVTPPNDSSISNNSQINTESPSRIYEEIKDKEVEDFERRVGFSGKEGPLAAFNYLPKRVNFINKDPEEKIILFLRRHPITNIPWVSLSFFLTILPSFLTALPFFESIPPRMGILFILIWYLLTFAYVIERFLDWFFTVDIVTDERIIDVDFYNLIARKMSDTNIDKIQDVTVQHIGGMRAIFNYGDILIQTAAEIPEIDFEAVPEPDKIAKVLRELRVEEEIEKLEGRVR